MRQQHASEDACEPAEAGVGEEDADFDGFVGVDHDVLVGLVVGGAAGFLDADFADGVGVEAACPADGADAGEDGGVLASEGDLDAAEEAEDGGSGGAEADEDEGGDEEGEEDGHVEGHGGDGGGGGA